MYPREVHTDPDPFGGPAHLQHWASRSGISLLENVQLDSAEFWGGGNAVVRKGILSPVGKKVAVKSPRVKDDKSEWKVRKVLREAYIWSKVQHDNVIPLIGITTQFDGSPSLVSSWMSKGNARAYVQDPQVDPRPLLGEIGNALGYLHSFKPHPIYHGDVKGLNVLISDDGHALLTDFGLAYSHVLDSSDVIHGFNGGGTLRWMAPEFFDVEACYATAQGDVWAFGMTMLELFTRRDPFFETSTQNGIICRILRGTPGRPTDEITQYRLSDEWWGALSRCWIQDPSKRPWMSDIQRLLIAM
ncbi:hypothetical protein ID866_8650 [Astraeus odoratus]|nr:hypothetical protein ID866_8650 [Astraeus odoratus]